MLIVRKSLLSGIVRTRDIPVTPAADAPVRVPGARAGCVPYELSADTAVSLFQPGLPRGNGRRSDRTTSAGPGRRERLNALSDKRADPCVLAPVSLSSEFHEPMSALKRFRLPPVQRAVQCPRDGGGGFFLPNEMLSNP